MSLASDFQSKVIDALTAIIDVSEDNDLSSAVELHGTTAIGIIFPAGMTSTAITFMVSVDGTTYYELKASSGTAIGLTINSDAAAYPLSGLDFCGWRYLKIKTGSAENADRTIKIVPYPIF